VARKTGQWWLGDLTAERAAKVQFDGEDYADFLNTLASFQTNLARFLQTTGQTAPHVD